MPPPGKPLIYYQRQVGGNCRLHSLNGYFGHEKITQTQWSEYQTEYDKILKSRYNTDTSCKQYDMISSAGQTIVSWILMIHGIHTRYFPPQFRPTHTPRATPDVLPDWLFLFNSNHIWGIRYYEPHKEWFKVDSLSGISSFDIRTLETSKDGIIVPITDNEREFARLGDLISATVEPLGVAKYIHDSNDRNEPLGDLEVYMGSAFACLDSQMHKNKCGNRTIQILINEWYHFLSVWTNKKCNDVDFMLRHVPHFVETIIRIK